MYLSVDACCLLEMFSVLYDCVLKAEVIKLSGCRMTVAPKPNILQMVLLRAIVNVFIKNILTLNRFSFQCKLTKN